MRIHESIIMPMPPIYKWLPSAGQTHQTQSHWPGAALALCAIIVHCFSCFFDMIRPGLFFIFSAPSGAGKTSITRALLDKDPSLYTSISATTRPAREGEVHGKHYYFLDLKTFSDALENTDFIEHAQVFHNHYGTLKQPLELASTEGKDALLALDSQGARSMRALYGSKTILIYILPPQLSDLKDRLYLRAQESPQKINHRLSCAYTEIQNCVDYDYIITNDDLNIAIDEAWSIIKSERCRFRNQPSAEYLLQRFSQNTEALDTHTS